MYKKYKERKNTFSSILKLNLYYIMTYFIFYCKFDTFMKVLSGHWCSGAWVSYIPGKFDTKKIFNYIRLLQSCTK